LSWNVLDEPRDLSELWREVASFDADVVALQEMEWWAYEQLLESSLARDFPHEGPVRRAERDLPGWLHLRSRQPMSASGVVVFEASQTGRGMLFGTVDGIVVGTTHMESDPRATTLRLGQIAEMHNALSTERAAVILGDLNFDGDPEAEAFERLGWEDAALTCGVVEPTWNPRTNAWAARCVGDGDDTPLRIDRAYVKGCRVQGFEVGIDGPSDHRPIVVDVERR
jgi:endonuclease/exonuclease/phosphatase family metal-dependent hydrolase